MQTSTSIRSRVIASILVSGTLLLAGCGSGVVTSLPGASSPALSSAAPNGPQLGYIWRPDDATLRPILGIPGSSQVGTSVVAAGTYATGAGSAASSVGLLVTATGQVYSMSLPSGPAVALNTTVSTTPVIRFSPSGVAAVLFTPGSQQATVLTGLLGTTTARSVSFTAPANDVAISDGGTVAAALAGSVSVVNAAGALQPVVALTGAGSLAFAGTGDTLVAVDSGANLLLVIRSASSSPSAAPVVTAGYLKAPVGVGASLDGRWAVVANGGESSAIRVDLTGATAPVRLLSSAQPTTVQPLKGNGVFRVNDFAAGTPLWLSDATAASPSLLFVPAVPATTAPAASAQASNSGVGR